MQAEDDGGVALLLKASGVSPRARRGAYGSLPAKRIDLRKLKMTAEDPLTLYSPRSDFSVMNNTIMAALMLLGATSCGYEQPRGTSTAVAPNTVTSASLTQLDWLAGYWAGEQDGTHMEEVWLPARGDVMVGLHMDLFASGRSFFEYLRIEQRGDTLVLAASPRGRPATPFTATSVTDSSVIFQNPDHDFPQRISYHVDPAGQLHAGISGTEDGTQKSSEWVWQRDALPLE